MTGFKGSLAAVAKLALAAILIFAMLDLLAGVLLRYVVVEITDYFDLPSVSFFWVEELGELALAWLTLLGAAVAILERTHFALSVLTHRFSPPWQQVMDRVNHGLIAVFGALVAIYGWRVSALNSVLLSPGLEINLGWLYAAAVVGGTLMAIFGASVALGLVQPREHVPPGAA